MIDNEDLIRMVDGINPWLIKTRRHFHMNPELSEKEYGTRDYIIRELESMGIESEIVCNTGVVGIIRGRSDIYTVGLRADIDALAMNDNKKVEYRSRNKGAMHACGHDAHTTILLGAARILNSMKDDLPGNVKLIFQPAEETVGGAKPMIDAGVLENPRVDSIFGLHVDNSLECGKIGLKYNQMKAASDMITIRVYGQSAHGAYPQNGVDALAIAANIVTSLQTIVARKLDPRRSGVVSIGTIKGGYARNVIADYIEMEGIVRTLDGESRDLTLANLESLVTGIGESMGGRAELIIDEGYSYLINDDAMLDIVRQNTEDVLGEEAVYIMPYPSYGVEDFAFFAEERPAAFFNLGTGNISKGIIHEGHTDLFDIDEDGLKIGVILQVKNVLEVFKNGGK